MCACLLIFFFHIHHHYSPKFTLSKRRVELVTATAAKQKQQKSKKKGANTMLLSSIIKLSLKHTHSAIDFFVVSFLFSSVSVSQLNENLLRGQKYSFTFQNRWMENSSMYVTATTTTNYAAKISEPRLFYQFIFPIFPSSSHSFAAISELFFSSPAFLSTVQNKK